METVFSLISSEYEDCIKKQFQSTSNQLDIVVDILIRDGNSLMSREWLLKLYEKEVKSIKSKLKELKQALQDDQDDERIRDYKIYRDCVEVAYINDDESNRERNVTSDEQSILNKLVESLDLSHEEVKLLNHLVIPLQKLEVDELISLLVKSGIIFYSKKNHQIYVPDEVINTLRAIRGQEVPTKIYKRLLSVLKSSQINLIARKHIISYKLTQPEKIKMILGEGISFSRLLLTTIHKPKTNKTDKKKAVIEIIEKGLKINERIGGSSLEDKVDNFVMYLNEKDKDDAISISLHGFNKLLTDLRETIEKFEILIRNEYELQETVELEGSTLIAHGLKPLDILNVLPGEAVRIFCDAKVISSRGNSLNNIFYAYRDVQNLYLENYISISNRDLASLKSNKIDIREADLGIQYENLTKLIFQDLKLNVDEKLRMGLNTKKDKIDILLNLGNSEVIIVECKSTKDKKLSTYSSASRQIKAYKALAEKDGLKVVKTFIVAPLFSDNCINECGLDYDLNLSLLTSEALLDIHSAFQESKLEEFPYKILLRDVLIDSSRVVRSITK